MKTCRFPRDAAGSPQARCAALGAALSLVLIGPALAGCSSRLFDSTPYVADITPTLERSQLAQAAAPPAGTASQLAGEPVSPSANLAGEGVTISAYPAEGAGSGPRPGSSAPQATAPGRRTGATDAGAAPPAAAGRQPVTVASAALPATGGNGQTASAAGQTPSSRQAAGASARTPQQGPGTAPASGAAGQTQASASRATAGFGFGGAQIAGRAPVAGSGASAGSSATPSGEPAAAASADTASATVADAGDATGAAAAAGGEAERSAATALQTLGRPASPAQYPNLADVPDRPRDLPTPAQRAEMQRSLEADRAALQQGAVPPSVQPQEPPQAELTPPARQSGPPRLTLPESGSVAPQAAGPSMTSSSASAGRTAEPAQPRESGRATPQTSPATASGDRTQPAAQPASQERAPSSGSSAAPGGAASGATASSFLTAPRPAAAARGAPLATLLFAQGSSTVSPTDVAALRDVAARQRAQGGTIRVVGHAGSGGEGDPAQPRPGNGGLSLQRASAVADQLVRLGVERSRIAVVAAADSGSAADGAAARRAEIYLDY